MRNRRLAVIAAAVLTIGATLTAAPPASAVAVPACFGFTEAAAAALGYETHLGTSGDDIVAATGTTPIWFYGDTGDDIVRGSDYGDLICLGSGNDFADAGDGSDQMTGDEGNDVINLGPSGSDAANSNFGQGGDGNDLIVATGNGKNNLIGDTQPGQPLGQGIDILIGADGDDMLDGGGLTDLMVGGGGNDTMFGGDGTDLINGGGGTNTGDAGNGTDLCINGTFNSCP